MFDIRANLALAALISALVLIIWMFPGVDPEPGYRLKAAPVLVTRKVKTIAVPGVKP